MRVAEVADVDCFGAVVGELVGAGAADAIGRVCAWFLLVCFLNGLGNQCVLLTGHDYYLVLDATVDLISYV